MNTEQAVQNIDMLMAGSRLTRQDHVNLQQSLELLKSKAQAYDLERESATEPPKAPEREE